MKNKPVDMMEIQQNSISEAVNMAANNFMILNVTVGRWMGTKKLKEASKKVAVDNNADIANVSVPLLGKVHHEKLKAVRSEYSKVYTIFDELCMQYVKGMPEKLAPVTDVPQILAALNQQKQIAENTFAEFIPDYEQFIKEALPTHGVWASEVKKHFPSVAVLKEKFYVTIHDPKPVPAMDMAKYGCVPTDTMGKIVAASNKALALKFESVKDAAVDRAIKAAELGVTQLSKEKPRMYQSVIEKAKTASNQLRQMSKGYRPDMRIDQIADAIDNEVLNVEKASEWTHNETKKAEALSAATVTVSNLKRMKVAAPIPDKPVADDTLVTGGLLADLL